MITKITGEQPFQVLTNNFSISPSNEGYTLQISADGKNFSNLFTVGAGVTRLVTGVAANSYYRLSGNQSQVSINWMKVCVTEGGEASGTELSPVSEFPAAAEAGTVIAYSGSSSATGIYQFDGTDWVAAGGSVDLSAYWTSAQTQSAITEAVSGKADAKILVDFDHTSQAERAALYADLYDLYDGGSGATINRNYDFYKTVNTWQGQKIDYYTFSGDTLVFGQVVSPENLTDQLVYAQVMTIDSAGTVNVITNTVGGASGGTEEIELPIAAAVNELKTNVEAKLDQQYYKKQDVLNLIQDKVTAGQVSEQVADIIAPLFEAVYAEIENKELAISAALNDLNDKKVASETVKVIWSGSQNEYDALTNSGATADSHTQYVIL